MEYHNKRILEVKNLSVGFKTRDGSVDAVKSINFSIDSGKTLALVGESGSGKSVTARSILQLLPYKIATHSLDSSIKLNGKELIGLKKSQMKAIILNLTAWSVLPIMDGMAKHLSTEMHFIEVVWARYFFMVLISVPLIYIFFRKYLVWPKNLLLQLSRSIFLFLSTVLFFYSISVISMAKALTLAFVAPIIVTILSALILKEKVGIHRWSAVI